MKLLFRGKIFQRPDQSTHPSRSYRIQSRGFQIKKKIEERKNFWSYLRSQLRRASQSPIDCSCWWEERKDAEEQKDEEEEEEEKEIRVLILPTENVLYAPIEWSNQQTPAISGSAFLASSLPYKYGQRVSMSEDRIHEKFVDGPLMKNMWLDQNYALGWAN